VRDVTDLAWGGLALERRKGKGRSGRARVAVAVAAVATEGRIWVQIRITAWRLRLGLVMAWDSKVCFCFLVFFSRSSDSLT
jgi:hypothetical protein